MSLQLTQQAADRILHFLTLDDDAVGFRVSVKKMGCSGWGYDVELAHQVKGDEITMEDKGVTLIVPQSALDKVEGTVIDYEKQGINQIFVYKNPNATGSCGCGESFTTN
ncbi:iron-sulfur cluster assembly accessory protein [Marinicella sp. S1101]|uniref:HesB/IscA family protein n=1 Tax=Marinicella marina TaxID=2996016 RepID=UPI002260EEFB|nr:iron-sulfur cluster assembly accessory protein [Marinicella marina]MCX7553897.1 iron-sulfur cluster assembly accessory protein [Marinicella marina]MDJ1140389.1 iron-sulfur cluster assembly accessory protein [Marinicella marina]